MADFTDDVQIALTLDLSVSDEVGAVDLDMTGSLIAPSFFQRIYDSSLAQYVYYTKGEIDLSPLVTDTVPNHTGSLVTATHEIIKEN